MKNIHALTPKHVFKSNNYDKIQKNQIMRGLNFSPEDITAIFKAPAWEVNEDVESTSFISFILNDYKKQY